MGGARVSRSRGNLLGMVKLRVAARVIPESDYNAAQSTKPAERKFLVVVRNPEQWYIGSLAVEVQNTYKRIYKQ